MVAPRRGIEVWQHRAVDLDCTAVGVVQPAQQLGDRGLTGPVLTDDGQRGTGWHVQIEPVEHGPTPAALGEALDTRVGEGDITKDDVARRRHDREMTGSKSRVGSDR